MRQVAVITRDPEKFLGYTIGEHEWGDVEFIHISHHAHCLGRQIQGAVILDHLTPEIENSLWPTIASFNGAIQDLRPDEEAYNPNQVYYKIDMKGPQFD